MAGKALVLGMSVKMVPEDICIWITGLSEEDLPSFNMGGHYPVGRILRSNKKQRKGNSTPSSIAGTLIFSCLWIWQYHILWPSDSRTCTNGPPSSYGESYTIWFPGSHSLDLTELYCKLPWISSLETNCGTSQILSSRVNSHYKSPLKHQSLSVFLSIYPSIYWLIDSICVENPKTTPVFLSQNDVLLPLFLLVWVSVCMYVVYHQKHSHLLQVKWMQGNAKEKLHRTSKTGKEDFFFQDYWNKGSRLNSNLIKQNARSFLTAGVS